MAHQPWSSGHFAASYLLEQVWWFMQLCCLNSSPRKHWRTKSHLQGERRHKRKNVFWPMRLQIGTEHLLSAFHYVSLFSMLFIGPPFFLVNQLSFSLFLHGKFRNLTVLEILEFCVMLCTYLSQMSHPLLSFSLEKQGILFRYTFLTRNRSSDLPQAEWHIWYFGHCTSNIDFLCNANQ